MGSRPGGVIVEYRPGGVIVGSRRGGGILGPVVVVESCDPILVVIVVVGSLK